MQAFVDRFRYKASKARQAQSRLKALAKLKPIAIDRDAAVTGFAFPDPEELSPPILRLEGAAAGYDGKPVLRNLDLRIDQDDRIALLGQNGEGKSTLAKLISGRLAPLAGRVVTAPKLRIGYFAQHQVDELDLDATPLATSSASAPTRRPASCAPASPRAASAPRSPQPRSPGSPAARRRGCRSCSPPSTRRTSSSSTSRPTTSTSRAARPSSPRSPPMPAPSS
jgi:ATPase subunit of ABC transporter with duplicated ATPase domains